MNKHVNDDKEDKLRLSSPGIYELVAVEGKEEFARPYQSLAWSAFVAGICINFSIFCEGFIKLHVPQSGDYFLLENLGYTIGFIIVIMGRFQLFTENTITVILPLLERFSYFKFIRTMKLWAIVLIFNMIGTFLIAMLISNFPFFSPEQMAVFIDISKHAVEKDLFTIFITAIPAGFLIATLVWMLPSAQGSKFWVILLMTYVIAIGDFAHIIAGSGEVFLLFFAQETSIAQGIGYLIMAALGNIIGGTGLFAVMAYAQVREEI